jgi:patatin-like phospholipase/acyl hydrolase
MPDKRLILSIDGGGLRGILPACILAGLEESTGKATRDIFSFVGGTSTGAVLAGGLVAGIPARQMLGLYLERASEVFPQRPWNFIKRLLFGHMYSSPTLNRVLSEESGQARSWRLNDSPIDLLITAKRVDDGMPWYFVKDSTRNSGRTGKLPLVDCVTASAVAPTYFQPWLVPEPNPPPGHRPVGTLVDGGVGVAGNPAYQTCVEAFWYTEGYSPDDSILVSLGTGRSTGYGKMPRWILSWLKWTLNELLDSANEQQTDLIRRHFPRMPFYRIDTTLPRPIPQDGIKSIAELHEVGEAFAGTIDWAPILAGEDSPFRIRDDTTLPREYKKRGGQASDVETRQRQSAN